MERRFFTAGTHRERFKTFAMPAMVFFVSKGNYLEDYTLEGYTGAKKFLEIARTIR